jgi:hypothetical protein
LSILFLTKSILLNIIRQKTIIFSTLILPIVIILSTWWVTVDIPIVFKLGNGEYINANMINVHVITGGLTAMGITSGVFGFLISTEYQNLSNRLRQVGYPQLKIFFCILLALFTLLTVTSIIAIVLSIYLSNPISYFGLALSIILITFIYATVGNLVSVLISNNTSGTLVILIFSFIDLMLLSNPMGEELYLKTWTYYLPGFWPVQIALISGFIGFSGDIYIIIVRIILYFSVLIAMIYLIKRTKTLVGNQ